MKKTNHMVSAQGQRWVLVFLLVFGLLSIIATGGDGDGGSSPAQDTATVSGVVSGSGGLVDVTVSAGGKSTTTDANGYYALENIPIPSDGQIVLTFDKAGYATFQRSLSVANGETYAVAASLLQYHHSESMDAAQSNDMTVLDPNNVAGPALAELSFPAGSVAANGNVTVEVAVGDPTTEAGRPTFPGDYMAASTAGGNADTPLESVVFTEITVTDDSGTELTQLNAPATVTVQLPTALQSQYQAGDEIPWWSYDETTATWVREDADPDTADVMDDAKVIALNGLLYAQAKVTHLTWWNVDHPMTEHACLCVNALDGNEHPMAGSQLFAEGVTYNGTSRPARTNAAGRACVTVKRSTESVTERVKLYIESGDVRFYYDVTDAEEGDLDTDEVFSPIMEGSTVYNTGECVNLTNAIAQRYDGVVNGTVTYEVSGSPVPDFTILSDFGPTATTDAEGKYSINVPVGVPISLFAVGLVSQSVTVADAGTPVSVDFVVPNRAPVISQLTRMPDGSVTSNQEVSLNVMASDADGDALSYAWSATAGSLNQTTGSSVKWTAPATGSGTAQVTVVVSDSGGEQTSRTVSIVYTEAAQTGSRLSFVVKDDLRSDQPVQGVTVALYNTDNRTIAQTKTSDASGVVDFGDIGRSRATITIAYEENAANRYIDTFVNVLAAENIVYYLDDSGPDYRNVDNPVASIDLALSEIPQGAGYTQFQPLLSAYWNHTFGFVNMTNITVGSVHLQDDGKLSLLATSFADASRTTLVGYSYLLDQTVTNGASYDVTPTRSPLILGWTTSPATALDSLEISGMRGGVRYDDLSGRQLPSASSGSMPFASEFPVDYYWVEAVADTSVTTFLSSDERHDTLPQSITVTMPDYSFGSFDYADATRTLTWGVTGSTPRDFVVLNMSGFSGIEQMVEWTVVQVETASSWQVIDLPAPANTWIDTTDPTSSITYADVEVCDFDVAAGMDQLWQFFITGNSVDEAAQYIRCGSRELDLPAATTSVASKASTGDPAQGAAGRGASGLLNKGLGHLRRR